MEIIIISGRSGAGKSVALRALEDMGYYCVDNLPLDLLPQLTKFSPTLNRLLQSVLIFEIFLIPVLI